LDFFMRRVASALASIISVIGLGSATAADIVVKAAAPPVVAAYNWTGCYLGGYAGGAKQSREVNAWDPRSTGGVFSAGTFYNPTANNHPANKVDIGEFNYHLGASAIGGGTLGCNWQGASPLVFGIEGEGGYMKVSASTVVPYSTGSDTVALTRIGDWYAAATGRVGYASRPGVPQGWRWLLQYPLLGD
jgi:outer membrane immunogenic protein